MTAFDEALIRMVDARIAAAVRRTVAMGTVVARDEAGTGATVIFDGATTSVPVKVFGHVHTIAGDRVGLQLFNTTWVVVGTFARRQLGEASIRTFGPGVAASTASATFVDAPSDTSLLMTKRYDATMLQLRLHMTTWASVTDTEVQSAVRIEGAPGTDAAVTFTPIDVTMGYMQYDATGIRVSLMGQARIINVPAGEYTLTARWRRAAGTGNCLMDSDDLVTLEADEQFRTEAS